MVQAFVAVVVPYHHRVQVVLLQTRAPMRLDVVHEREDALSLGSVDRNEQHEDHKAEHVALMCEFQPLSSSGYGYGLLVMV